MGLIIKGTIPRVPPFSPWYTYLYGLIVRHGSWISRQFEGHFVVLRDVGNLLALTTQCSHIEFLIHTVSFWYQSCICRENRSSETKYLLYCHHKTGLAWICRITCMALSHALWSKDSASPGCGLLMLKNQWALTQEWNLLFGSLGRLFSFSIGGQAGHVRSLEYIHVYEQYILHYSTNKKFFVFAGLVL